jgi:two-component system, LytTR family, sensor kinase
MHFTPANGLFALSCFPFGAIPVHLRMKRWGRHIYYLVFGGLFFLFWLLFKVGGMPVIPLALLSTAIDVAVTMGVLVITVEVLLPRLVYRRKIGLFVGCFLALVLLGGTAIILSQLRLLGRSLFTYQKDLARYQEHYFYWFWADLVFGSYFMVFFVSSIGAAVRLAISRMQAMNLVERLQKEKAMSELALLKHQINPHFLFNALNTVYYKIDRRNGAARETLQRFSNMLRYQLYECEQSLVEVEKELDFIGAYVDLQKQRLNDNYTISCTGVDGISGFLIAPFLLMPLVENCFKHVSGHPVGSGLRNTISIGFVVEGSAFTLRACNSVGEAVDQGGIGLENMRRRLELVYPGRHGLVIRAGTDLFEAELSLTIDR